MWFPKVISVKVKTKIGSKTAILTVEHGIPFKPFRRKTVDIYWNGAKRGYSEAQMGFIREDNHEHVGAWSRDLLYNAIELYELRDTFK